MRRGARRAWSGLRGIGRHGGIGCFGLPIRGFDFPGGSGRNELFVEGGLLDRVQVEGVHPESRIKFWSGLGGLLVGGDSLVMDGNLIASRRGRLVSHHPSHRFGGRSWRAIQDGRERFGPNGGTIFGLETNAQLATNLVRFMVRVGNEDVVAGAKGCLGGVRFPGVGFEIVLMQGTRPLFGSTAIGEQVDPDITIDQHRRGIILREEINLTGEAPRGDAFRVPPFPGLPHAGDFHDGISGVGKDGAIDEGADGVPTARQTAATAAG